MLYTKLKILNSQLFFSVLGEDFSKLRSIFFEKSLKMERLDLRSTSLEINRTTTDPIYYHKIFVLGFHV